MMEILENLFGSKFRIRILRFFLRNNEQSFSMEEIKRRTKVNQPYLREELKLLEAAGFLLCKKKEDFKGKKPQYKDLLFFLNPDFKLLAELRALIFGAGFVNKQELTNVITKVGKIRFAAVSGVFLSAQEPSRQGHNRVDLFLIADAIDKSKLKQALQNIEAEIGKEIVYSVLSTEEFAYRKDMYDKFVYDILEGPREDLVNKLKI
ncbi:MAG: hypothetical protein V1698_01405 [bacterium]